MTTSRTQGDFGIDADSLPAFLFHSRLRLAPAILRHHSKISPLLYSVLDVSASAVNVVFSAFLCVSAPPR